MPTPAARRKIQFRSCDHCRQRRRACDALDAAVGPFKDPGSNNNIGEYRDACSRCYKSRRKCTFHWVKKRWRLQDDELAWSNDTTRQENTNFGLFDGAYTCDGLPYMSQTSDEATSVAKSSYEIYESACQYTYNNPSNNVTNFAASRLTEDYHRRVQTNTSTQVDPVTPGSRYTLFEHELQPTGSFEAYSNGDQQYLAALKYMAEWRNELQAT